MREWPRCSGRVPQPGDHALETWNCIERRQSRDPQLWGRVTPLCSDAGKFLPETQECCFCKVPDLSVIKEQEEVGDPGFRDEFPQVPVRAGWQYLSQYW